MTPISVRPAEPADATAITSLALDNQMFDPEDMGPFDEMLAGFFSGELSDHHWVAAVDEEERIRDFYGPGDHKVTFWKPLVD